jgi:transposase
MPGKPVLGIDVAKKTFQAAWLVKGKWKNMSLPNSKEGFEKLQGLLGERYHICLEATGRYGNDLARSLFDAGHTVSVVNPMRIQRYAESRLRRTKTDRADAVLIAEFCDREFPRPWMPLPPEVEELRELIRRREHLLESKQRERNRQLAGQASPAVEESIARSLQFAKTELKLIERAIETQFRAHPHLAKQRELLVSIPGIGNMSAAILIAEIGDLSKFDSPKSLVAFFGLAPKEHSSGTSVRGRAGISKMGNPRVRRVLYMAALSAKRKNEPIVEFCQRLKGQKPTKVIHVAVMRKLLHQAFGVLTHEESFNPHKEKERVQPMGGEEPRVG